MNLPDYLRGNGARVVAVILLAIGIGAVVVAVVRDDEPDRPGSAAGADATQFPTLEPVYGDPYRLTPDPGAGKPPDWVVEVLPGMSEGWPTWSKYVRDLLIDGDLSFAEYEAATLATLGCIEDEGYALLGGPTYNDVERKFDYEIAAGQSIETFDDARSRCQREYLDPLQFLWEEMHARTEQDTAAAAAFLHSCLVTAGLTDAPPPTTDEYDQWYAEVTREQDADMEKATGCVFETERRWGFVP